MTNADDMKIKVMDYGDREWIAICESEILAMPPLLDSGYTMDFAHGRLPRLYAPEGVDRTELARRVHKAVEFHKWETDIQKLQRDIKKPSPLLREIMCSDSEGVPALNDEFSVAVTGDKPAFITPESPKVAIGSRLTAEEERMIQLGRKISVLMASSGKTISWASGPRTPSVEVCFESDTDAGEFMRSLNIAKSDELIERSMEGPRAWEDAKSTPLEDVMAAKRAISNLKDPSMSDSEYQELEDCVTKKAPRFVSDVVFPKDQNHPSGHVKSMTWGETDYLADSQGNMVKAGDRVEMSGGGVGQVTSVNADKEFLGIDLCGISMCVRPDDVVRVEENLQVESTDVKLKLAPESADPGPTCFGENETLRIGDRVQIRTCPEGMNPEGWTVCDLRPATTNLLPSARIVHDDGTVHSVVASCLEKVEARTDGAFQGGSLINTIRPHEIDLTRPEYLEFSATPNKEKSHQECSACWTFRMQGLGRPCASKCEPGDD